MRILHNFGSLLIGLALWGCSVNSSPASRSTPPPTQHASVPTPAVREAITPAVAATKVPVTWADLNLTGRLIYIDSNSANDNVFPRIQSLDLTTGDIFTIFQASKGDWIFYMDVFPDGGQLVISYIDQSRTGTSSNRALYTLRVGEPAAPQLLFMPPTDNDHYTQAEWSSDGKYIYFAHYNDKKPQINNLTPDYDIYRIAYPAGPPEKIADHAFWPRLSADATRLAYVSIDSGDGKNGLVVANADGSDPQSIAFPNSWNSDVIDAPVFSPDGQSLLFSAPSPTQAYQPNWFDKLMGVQIVSAHSLPSDWWSVPVAGGTPTRLTHLETENLFASLLPDQKHLVSLSEDGMFVMELDGSNIVHLFPDSGLVGSVRWMP